MLPYITSIVHLFTYRTYDHFRNQHKQTSVTIKQYAKIHRDVAKILSLGGLKPMVSAELVQSIEKRVTSDYLPLRPFG